MRILVDADALPGVIRDILFRAAERTGIPLVLVANQELRLTPSPLITFVCVPAGPDVADDRIVELVHPGDLVVTADIPLADRVVARGALALDPRGTLFTPDNIKERLAVRDLMDGLRGGGLVTGGPAAMGPRDRQAFANQLDRILSKHLRERGATS